MYITTQDDVIPGYYAITTATHSRDDVPQGLGHRNRPEEIPRILLARLAVDEWAQGRGVSATLLKSMTEWCYKFGREVSAAALTVHYRNEQTHAFYLASGNFLPSPADALHLLPSMGQLGRMFGSS